METEQSAKFEADAMEVSENQMVRIQILDVAGIDRNVNPQHI